MSFFYLNHHNDLEEIYYLTFEILYGGQWLCHVRDKTKHVIWLMGLGSLAMTIPNQKWPYRDKLSFQNDKCFEETKIRD